MNESIVSEVSFYPLRPTEKGLIGIAGCLWDNNLALNSISVYLTPTGDIRLLFPNKVLRNGKDINLFYPVNKATYEIIRQAIVKKIETIAKNVERK